MEERLECLPPAIRIAVAVRSIRRIQPLHAAQLEPEQQKRIEEFLRLAEVCARGPDAAFVKGRKWLQKMAARQAIASDPTASDFVRAANSAREAFIDSDDAGKSATAVATAVQCSIAASTLNADCCAATAVDADLKTAIAIAIADANIVWVDSGAGGPFGAYWCD
jgi:hypothetical protein